MQKDHLPLKIDPFRFAEHALRLSGFLRLEELTRVAPSLSSSEGVVEVELAFGVDEQEIRFVRGQLTTCLILQCQRCLEPFKYAIINDFVLGIVHAEDEAEQLPKRYEPLVAMSGELFLKDLVEEELLVSLPLVPMHPAAECKVQLPLVAEMENEHPFKAITVLRTKRENK